MTLFIRYLRMMRDDRPRIPPPSTKTLVTRPSGRRNIALDHTKTEELERGRVKRRRLFC